MIIIGLLGKAYSGKTTIAKHLEAKGFKRLAFADYLKTLARGYFNLTEEDIQNKPPHVRTLLQGLGMLIREQFDPWLLMEKVFNRIKYSNGNLFVIEDIRLEEEAQFIKEMKAIIIKIECHNNPLRLTEEQQSHETEKIDTIPYDYLISANYGNINKLKAEIDEILGKINKVNVWHEGHKERL